MTQQLDMFASAAPSFAPALDPDKAFEVVCRPATDRDHVGRDSIGRLGNNREVWLVLTLTESQEVLACETFSHPDECQAYRMADAHREGILRQLKKNGQRDLF